MDITNKAEVFEAAVELLNMCDFKADYYPDHRGNPAIVTNVGTMIGWAITVVINSELTGTGDPFASARDIIPQHADLMDRDLTIFY